MVIPTAKVPSSLAQNILLCQKNTQSAGSCRNCMQAARVFSDTTHVNFDYHLGSKQHLEDTLIVEISEHILTKLQCIAISTLSRGVIFHLH